MNVEDLLKEAMGKGASDLHLSVGKPPIARVEGELISLSEDALTAAKIEKLIQLILSEEQISQLKAEGEFDFAYSFRESGRFRINFFRQRGTYAAAIRLMPFAIPKPEEIGIPEPLLNTLLMQRGLVLVTGTASSGKSTTIASMIEYINQNAAKHIITVEDPIEYLHKSERSIINQREIGLDTKNYKEALQNAMHQDADVIFIGEMRDTDTVEQAIHAAENGCLVFSTLHTIGAVETVNRIVDIFQPHQRDQIQVQLSAILKCILSQQLVPSNSEDKHRIAIFETMLSNYEIKKSIRENKTYQIPQIMQKYQNEGMNTMDDSLYECYMRNQITRETALEFAVEPYVLLKKCNH